MGVLAAVVALVISFIDLGEFELVTSGVVVLVAFCLLQKCNAQPSSRTPWMASKQAVDVFCAKQSSRTPRMASKQAERRCSSSSQSSADSWRSSPSSGTKSQEARPEHAKQLCWHWAQRGACRMGDSCGYSHNESLRQIYLAAQRRGAEIHFF